MSMRCHATFRLQERMRRERVVATAADAAPGGRVVEDAVPSNLEAHVF